jgi:DnaA family protein
MSGPDATGGVSRGRQLALRFPLADTARFETFEPGDNAELVRRLQGLADEAPVFRGCYLFGPAGAGRSPLLQAACQRHADGRGAIYLPLAEPGFGPDMLAGLASRGLVALDDIEALIGNPEAEAAVLALYQELQAAGGRLLVAAMPPPASLVCHYPDLASRLRGLPAYRVRPLDDAGKARVLARLADRRGLETSRAVLDFWLARSPRDLPALLRQLEALDTAAMAAQRQLTIPLIKEVLGL